MQILRSTLSMSESSKSNHRTINFLFRLVKDMSNNIILCVIKILGNAAF